MPAAARARPQWNLRAASTTPARRRHRRREPLRARPAHGMAVRQRAGAAGRPDAPCRDLASAMAPGLGSAADEGRMHRRRARVPLLRDPVQAERPRRRDRRLRAESRGRHLRLGSRVLGRDARQLRGGRPGQLRAHPPELRLLDRHRHVLPRRQGHQHRPRLLRARARPAAADPARTLPGARHRAALPDRGHRRRSPGRRARPRRRRRRGQQPGSRALRHVVPAAARLAKVQVRMVRHDQADDGVHVRVPADGVGAVPGARLSVRRRPRHVDRRVPRADVAGGWPRPARRGAIGGVLRTAVRRPPRRRAAADEPVDLADVPDDPVRVVAARQRRAARRRGPHGALLDRIRHQAGDGGRDRARAGRARDTGGRAARARGVRERAAPRRAEGAARGADSSSGSRTARATSTRTRTGSCST